ncbi:MAG: hypothetical protein ABJQ23_04650 [Shimia thalassica]|uniref:hypothetical protein n=1 Tax=Shimia thalassica TaxID=1715693 RepID=UPI003299CE9C
MKASISSAVGRAIYIFVLYFVAHGITSLFVFPAQTYLLGTTSFFASLIYLPHGVRILSTWLFGWRAILPLFVAEYTSQVFFLPEDALATIRPDLIVSSLIGAVSGFLAFTVLHFAGGNFSFGKSSKASWTLLLVAGGIASAFNSIGQSILYSDSIAAADLALVLVIYALGDLLGLFICMLLMMKVFQWVR